MSAQWATKCVRPFIKRGVKTAWHVPLTVTTSWLLLPNQGRRNLGEKMTRMKTDLAALLILIQHADFWFENGKRIRNVCGCFPTSCKSMIAKNALTILIDA